jgi:hypothetical protein
VVRRITVGGAGHPQNPGMDLLITVAAIAVLLASFAFGRPA